MAVGFTSKDVNIPFGHGVTIGFTDDRYVWMVADSQDAGGHPIQSTFLWKPDRAVEVANKLKEAADKAVSKLILPGG